MSLEKILDKDIMNIFQPHIVRDDDPKDHMNFSRDDCPENSFTLKDLIGKTIIDYRKIRKPAGNPNVYGVLLFSDRSMLLTEVWGRGGSAEYYSYFYNGKKVLFSDTLMYAELE